jgi:hypothetical protein
VARVLKTIAITGGTLTPYAGAIRNMSAKASASGMSPGLRFRAMSRPSEPFQGLRVDVRRVIGDLEQSVPEGGGISLVDRQQEGLQRRPVTSPRQRT